MHIIKKNNVITFIEYSKSFNGFYVTEFGREFVTRIKQTPEHRNNFIIHFVINGKGVFNCDKKTFFLKSGDAFIITPMDLVSYYPSSSEDGWEYCWLNLSGMDCNTIFENCGLTQKKVFRFQSSDIKELIKMLEELDTIDLNCINQDAYSMKVMSMCYHTFANICERLKPMKTVDKVEKNESIIEKAIDYMNSKLSDNITISKLCKEINVSRSYFTTIFTNNMKQSPGSYLNTRRIHYACEILLTYKNLKISKVAEMSGFQSTAQFCKCFKKNVGITPAQYKENNGI